MQTTYRNPIGIFDSGVGGLSILKEVHRLLPYEDIIYLGDNARLPYGTKSRQAITQFALECADFLLEQKVKIIIPACNTISSQAMDSLVSHCPVPVIDIIGATTRQARQQAKNKTVGIIATGGTIRSQSYQRRIRIDQSLACPTLIELVERGTNNHEKEVVIGSALANLKPTDFLILGCTHFSLLKAQIQKSIGAGTKLIDSACLVAEEARQALAHNLNLSGQGIISCFFTSKIEGAEQVLSTLDLTPARLGGKMRIGGKIGG